MPDSDAPESSQPDLSGANPADLRQSARSSLFLIARCRIQGTASEVTVKLRNISATGLQAESTVVPRVGAEVSLDLRNLGWVDARVAWVHGNRFGLALAHTIDPSRIRQAPPPPPPTPDMVVRRPLAVRLQALEADPSRLRPI